MNSDLFLIWNTFLHYFQGLINVFEDYFITRFALGLIFLGLIVGILVRYLFGKKE